LPAPLYSADKAIDLVDEAAAKLKMEITSKPLALDEVRAGRLAGVVERGGVGLVGGEGLTACLWSWRWRQLSLARASPLPASC